MRSVVNNYRSGRLRSVVINYRSQNVLKITTDLHTFPNLAKVDFYASDNCQLILSAVAKLREYQRLQYPPGILRRACGSMAFKTGNASWHMIDRYVQSYSNM